jgi:hypothetical protein
MDVAATRATLEQAITSIQDLQVREADLERQLADVRRQRDAMDAAVSLAVKAAGLAGLEPSDWQHLAGGMHREISAACGRASLQPR